MTQRKAFVARRRQEIIKDLQTKYGVSTEKLKRIASFMYK